ncbi:threonine synthase [Nonlabens dokdonensis]|jgi:threonine synthase|uniref:Threonine synthase n=2 Tax=Nonlabens dokdonensis TaxID=328515 RepID=L7W9Q9_NONDD|nr:threonine synthase [Nonlabens dokdonensis]AGC78420.1 threonine synthase [Nonlabens dokdonensis DSW-6]PZX38167.1 threonine synthase [Nonlabens dokdonensis]
MKYYSLNKKAPKTSFEQAVVKGLAPDKGLYFPEEIQPLDKSFFDNIEQISREEIAFQAIQQFVSPEIPKKVLRQIIKETIDFDFPIVSLNNEISTLELFHGPTMAFKDVGARFMARCLGYFNQNNKEEITVLVATSGDTGGAVAHGFLGVKGIKVVILYPKGKVSNVQEKQLTTLGQNITALEVDGVFDDCQDMVKRAFLDQDLTSKMQLTSANSINVARWLPQMFYFFFTYQQLKSKYKQLVFSVPSGNFGNICAGMIAKKLGLPIEHFIAANNENNVITKFLKTKEYVPEPTIATLSNAMDVSNPSNFVRIQEIYDQDFEVLKKDLTSYFYTDKATEKALIEIKEKYNYIADPHGAIGYLACKDYLKENENVHCVFLETAHPTKFLPTVERVLNETVALPDQIKELMNKKKVAIEISNYGGLKNFLLSK